MKDVVIIFAILLVLLLLISTFGGSIRYKSPAPRFAGPSAYPPASYPAMPFGPTERFAEESLRPKHAPPPPPPPPLGAPGTGAKEGFYSADEEEALESYANSVKEVNQKPAGAVEAFAQDAEYANVEEHYNGRRMPSNYSTEHFAEPEEQETFAEKAKEMERFKTTTRSQRVPL
jgi:hypothetical protein